MKRDKGVSFVKKCIYKQTLNSEIAGETETAVQQQDQNDDTADEPSFLKGLPEFALRSDRLSLAEQAKDKTVEILYHQELNSQNPIDDTLVTENDTGAFYTSDLVDNDIHREEEVQAVEDFKSLQAERKVIRKLDATDQKMRAPPPSPQAPRIMVTIKKRPVAHTDTSDKRAKLDETENIHESLLGGYSDPSDTEDA